jgi:hypothetical protein
VAALDLTAMPVASHATAARQAVLNAQRAPAPAEAKLATESEDYCAEDDVAEQGTAQADGAAGSARYGSATEGSANMAQAAQGSHGVDQPSPTPKVGEVKLATESEDYCAEDDVKE